MDKKEQLVTFETAILADEKGFDWNNGESYYVKKKCGKYSWQNKGALIIQSEFLDETSCDNSNVPFDNRIMAPSQSMLQKWLREVHEIEVWASPFTYQKSIPDESYSFFLYLQGKWEADSVDYCFFELALEQGIQRALKLIKND